MTGQGLRRGIGRTGRRLAAVGVAIAISVSPLKAMSLGDALVSAYSHSGLLDQNRALLRAADEDVAIALARLRPILDWTGAFTRNFGNSTRNNVRTSQSRTSVSLGIAATLQIYDGGADRARVEAAKETVLATRAQLVNIEQQVLLRAATAFFNVIRQQRFVALRQNNLRLLGQEFRAANDRFEVGEVTRTDVALAEAAVAEARSNLAAAQRDLIQAQAEFTNIVGRPPNALQGMPPLPSAQTDISRAQAVAVRTHPEMDQAQREVAAADLAATAAFRDMSPTVNLRGQLGLSEDFGRTNSDNSETGSISIEVTGPISQGGGLYAAERKALALRDQARGNLHVTRHDVQQDVVDAISDLQAARASLAASENQIRAARVAFRGVREEATLGARTTLDVLDAEQNLLNAETNRISAQADMYIAAYGVLESMGLLTVQRLGLPVQTYDPAAYYNLVKDAPAKISEQGRALDRVIRALKPEN